MRSFVNKVLRYCWVVWVFLTVVVLGCVCVCECVCLQCVSLGMPKGISEETHTVHYNHGWQLQKKLNPSRQRKVSGGKISPFLLFLSLSPSFYTWALDNLLKICGHKFNPMQVDRPTATIHTHTHTHNLSLSHTVLLSHTLTHTHTHTHTSTLPHTPSLYLSLPPFLLVSVGNLASELRSPESSGEVIFFSSIVISVSLFN